MVIFQRFFIHFADGALCHKALADLPALAHQHLLRRLHQFFRLIQHALLHQRAHKFILPHGDDIFFFSDGSLVRGVIDALCACVPFIDKIDLRLHIPPLQRIQGQRVQIPCALHRLERAEIGDKQHHSGGRQQNHAQRDTAFQRFSFQFIQHAFLLFSSPIRGY